MQGCLPHAPSGQVAGSAFQGIGAGPDRPHPHPTTFQDGHWLPRVLAGSGRLPGLVPRMLVSPLTLGCQMLVPTLALGRRMLVPRMLVSPSAGVQDSGPPPALGHGMLVPEVLPPPLRRWRARLMFVMVALARGPSLAGGQLCGYSMYSER